MRLGTVEVVMESYKWFLMLVGFSCDVWNMSDGELVTQKLPKFLPMENACV